LITSLGAYPVNRGASDVRAIRKTVDILGNGECVCIFPQGTRYTGVKPNASQTRSGVGMIAFRSKVPVLPVLIQSKGWKVSPFKRVNVIIGKPITYDELGFTTGNKTEYEQASELIFDRIASMITDDYGEDTLMLPKPKEKYQIWETPKALPAGKRPAPPEGGGDKADRPED
ncbi:MAG: 1-acyl-sn-glycerol-3-phosphate acyltransferase, partial [Clostridiales bacterium]|nr:1-acyl-sn-glycerol-3-phosphate acyltransferase [Clostridiales bacterium]